MFQGRASNVKSIENFRKTRFIFNAKQAKWHQNQLFLKRINLLFCIQIIPSSLLLVYNIFKHTQLSYPYQSNDIVIFMIIIKCKTT